MRHTVEVEVSIDEFDDDALIAEVRSRSLEHKVLGEPEVAQNLPEDAAKDVYQWLATHRYDKAREAMRNLLATFLPPQIIAASEAIESGRWMDATCELEDFIWPSPAREATHLPLKPIAEASAS